MTIETILIVDDEPLILGFLEETLKRQRFLVDVAANGKQALSLLKKNTYDLVLTDLKMPDMSGMEILRFTQEVSKQTVVIVMTAYGTIENAVEAMRSGAFHYLLKPFTPDTIETLIKKADEHLALIHENQYWRSEIQKEVSSPIIVESPIMKKILDETSKIAKSQASVLI
ncbi:MAG: response regulator, partial [Chlamydiales bacterium]